MNKCFLSIGSNLGERLYNLEEAARLLRSNKIKITEISSIYETEPKGYKKQNNFYNMIMNVETSIPYIDLLLIIKNIEYEMGRDFYAGKNQPRVIDIDILTYSDVVFISDILTIPHPLIHDRKFVLVPWNEISSNYIIPNYEVNVNTLLKNTKDSTKVCKLDVRIE